MAFLNHLGKRRLFLPVILLAVGFFHSWTQAKAFNEYDLKAAFLYNFAQFVEWPPEAFESAQTHLVIGVLGEDPFGKTLDKIVQDEVVKNRKLDVQRYRRVEDIATCHILFISQSEAGRLGQILDRLKGKNILTVGDSENFAHQGGVVRLLLEKNKIRLRINIEAAKAARLTISSKVLRAAELVGAEGGDK